MLPTIIVKRCHASQGFSPANVTFDRDACHMWVSQDWKWPNSDTISSWCKQKLCLTSEIQERFWCLNQWIGQIVTNHCEENHLHHSSSDFVKLTSRCCFVIMISVSQLVLHQEVERGVPPKICEAAKEWLRLASESVGCWWEPPLHRGQLRAVVGFPTTWLEIHPFRLQKSIKHALIPNKYQIGIL